MSFLRQSSPRESHDTGRFIINNGKYEIYGCESKLRMERKAVFRTYGTKGLRNWSCSGHLECDEMKYKLYSTYLNIIYI